MLEAKDCIQPARKRDSDRLVSGEFRKANPLEDKNMLTRNRIILLALVGLLVIGLVSCAREATAGGGPLPAVSTLALQREGESLPRTISVNGSGIASARPDVASVQLGVETVNTDLSLAVNQNTERMTTVMDTLKTLGIEDKDVMTVQYSMWIEQPHDEKGQPSGEPRYHVVNQVSVKLHDLTKMSEVLDKTLAAGINTVNGISFSVADPTELKRQAREAAIADAKAKAEQLAAGLGAELGSLRQASEYSSGPVPFIEAPMEGYGIGGGGPVPVSGGEFSVTVEVQVVFDIAE
jgi:uncharacterized protein YggE